MRRRTGKRQNRRVSLFNRALNSVMGGFAYPVASPPAAAAVVTRCGYSLPFLTVVDCRGAGLARGKPMYLIGHRRCFSSA
jgi:hypothetical protein